MATSTATAETGHQTTHDRPGRRRPFSSWVKKLTGFKSSSTADVTSNPTTKRNTDQMKQNGKKGTLSKNNNPYPQSSQFNSNPANGNQSSSTVPTGATGSPNASSLDRSRRSPRSSLDEGQHSVAATSEAERAHSEATPSHAPSSGEATNNTVGGLSSARGNDSTFSSPAPSVRSLTTTLTTIQSVAPTAQQVHHGNNASIHFSHQFPTSPPTALPAHLAPQAQGSGGHPATYSTATANNLSTDNASILTLASSSKRRRRRSMDTDASVRALAPSSLFGGSRESLPLSVLSQNIDPSFPTSRHATTSSIAGLNERASIYSATGVTPALPSERNSYYAGKQSILQDGGSIKSGLLGHGRNDSVSGSIGGMPGSPLASPKEISTLSAGKLSRSNSAWGEIGEGEKADDEENKGSERV